MFPANYVEMISGPVPPSPSMHQRASTTDSRASTSSASHQRATTSDGARGAATVADCSQCGCNDYKPNAFKAGQCVSYYHAH
jgi:hypothetical protein